MVVRRVFLATLVILLGLCAVSWRRRGAASKIDEGLNRFAKR